MDVVKSLSVVAFLFALSACGGKTPSHVFPEGNGSQGSNACSGRSIENKFIVHWEDGTFTVEESENAEVFTEKFIKPNLEKIKFVEFDRQIEALRPSSAISTAPAANNWGQLMVKANTLWNENIFGEGIKVGIVDAYIDVNHPQIKPRIAVNTGEIPNNGLDDDHNGIIDDYYGAVFITDATQNNKENVHGTHVTGIVAADHSSGSVKGIAPRAQIIPAQFIDDDGRGSLGDAILALQYVANRGAKVINASWGGVPCVASLRDAFLNLEQRGILVVVAAGNDGRDVDYYPDFPASFNLSNQITVAASTPDDFMASFSNMGFSLVHLAAPGVEVYSTIPNNQAVKLDGTSMAAPFVTGAAALLWSARPQATAAQIKTALLQSVDVQPNHEFKVSTQGRLNIQKALAKLKQILP